MTKAHAREKYNEELLYIYLQVLYPGVYKGRALRVRVLSPRGVIKCVCVFQVSYFVTKIKLYVS